MGVIEGFKKLFKSGDLKKELAAPGAQTIRTVNYASQTYGMTPQSLASVLIKANQGDIQAYLTLAEEMEERDGHYMGTLSQRKNAVKKLPYSVVAPTEDAADLKIADACREMLRNIELEDVIFNMLDALGKGFSVNELMWDTSGSLGKLWVPKEIIWRDPRSFKFDIDTFSELRIRDEADILNGLEMPPFKFICHYPRIKTGLPIRGGLARLVAFLHLCKSYSLKDWMAFSEIFGQPVRLGRYDPANATEDDRANLLYAVANIGTDAAAIVSKDMEIEFVSATSSNATGAVFENHLNYLDKQISKAVVGQTMTSDDGSSRAQAEVHDLVRTDITDSDALQVARTLKRDLLAPFVRLNFGENVLVPDLILKREKGEDLESLAKSLTPFIDRGLRVEAAQIYDKFKITEPEKGAEILQPQGASVTKDTTEATTEAQNSLNMARNSRVSEVNRQKRAEKLVEDMVEEALEDWEKQIDPIISPIIKAANSSKNYEEFTQKLSTMLNDMDLTELADQLAVDSFKSAGIGADSDDTEEE